jgi:SHS2 domain-containing protein
MTAVFPERKLPYIFLEDVAIADVAFEAWGLDLEALFAAAADATLNVMVNDLNSVSAIVERSVSLELEPIDLLLLNYLQEIIFYKDAERLLLRTRDVKISGQGESYTAVGVLAGEELDMNRHDLVVDVKAVTLHQFRVEKTDRGWEAFVILDI